MIGGGDKVGATYACLLKAVVLLSTLYTHEKVEHNRKQFLEILFLLVSFGLLISDLRRKSVTILILGEIALYPPMVWPILTMSTRGLKVVT